jgi:hypothetical protein
MRTRIYICTILVIMCLPGCAIVYTGASTASLAVTGKSIPEHGASWATDSDCSTWNYVFKGNDYVCEQRDASRTYNRNTF